MSEFIQAFGAGILSFVSPCVLPLVPVYLSVISGVSMQELHEGSKSNLKRVFVSSLLFVVGFSIVFTAAGATASRIGGFLDQYKVFLTQAGGILVILMGLTFIGAAKIPFLQQERRFHIVQPGGAFGPILVGMAFAFGWTPCIAGFASTIMTYAIDSTTVTRGAALLLVYSLGLGVPLLITALAFTRMLVAFSWIKRNYTYVNATSGLILIGMGFLLLTHRMGMIQGLFSGRF